uniref:uncharacterized protein LOC106999321 n=1 Tax=Macaca mulatta TaxID=9544 RepID=UPI0007328911|nr:uncharacterized protein LOC106999321 [Macaca mulatta]
MMINTSCSAPFSCGWLTEALSLEFFEDGTNGENQRLKSTQDYLGSSCIFTRTRDLLSSTFLTLAILKTWVPATFLPAPRRISEETPAVFPQLSYATVAHTSAGDDFCPERCQSPVCKPA